MLRKIIASTLLVSLAVSAFADNIIHLTAASPDVVLPTGVRFDAPMFSTGDIHSWSGGTPEDATCTGNTCILKLADIPDSEKLMESGSRPLSWHNDGGAYYETIDTSCDFMASLPWKQPLEVTVKKSVFPGIYNFTCTSVPSHGA